MLTLLKDLQLLKAMLLLKGMLILKLLKGMLILKLLKVLQLKVHKLKVENKGKGRENSKCLQHSLKVQMPRKKDLLLELRVLFQPISRHLFMIFLFAMMKLVYVMFIFLVNLVVMPKCKLLMQLLVFWM